MTHPTSADAAEIATAVQNWAVWRDAGDWERFATVWSDDGYMCATWFQGSATDFIDASRRAFAAGVRILHFLGGTSVEVVGDRAIAQTKMTISQRGELHGVSVGVVCTGRFYDFFARSASGWSLVRRQPIYERDRIDPVVPGAQLTLDPTRLERLPEGYRHLGYLPSELGFDVGPDLPGLTGAPTEALYRRGRAWLTARGEGRARVGQWEPSDDLRP